MIQVFINLYKLYQMKLYQLYHIILKIKIKYLLIIITIYILIIIIIYNKMKKRKQKKNQIDFFDYMEKTNQKIEIFKSEKDNEIFKSEKDNEIFKSEKGNQKKKKNYNDNKELYIPINPFHSYNENVLEPFKLQLILIKRHCSIRHPENPKVVNYFISNINSDNHISDLQFIKIKIQEFKNYNLEKGPKKIYFFHKWKKYDVNKLNWDQFNTNKNLIISIINKFILGFFPEQADTINNDILCKINSENIFIEKVNNLDNKQLNIELVKYLKKIILDLNSLITSTLKIYNPYNFFSQMNLANLHMFESIYL